MNWKTKNIKKIIFVLIVVIAAYISFFVLIEKNDGMKNIGILNTYYRTYTKKNGWSKWSKNGIISGNKKDSITKIQIKTRGVDKTTFDVYDSIKWNSGDNLKEKSNITAVKFHNSYEFLKRYQMCYRTYNNTNKWLNWNCDNGGVSGTDNKPITAIEIKSIPSNVIYYEYLKNYTTNNNESFIGF